MNAWKPLGDLRKIKQHTNGFYMIKPLSMPDRIPVACPVCRVLMRNSQDAYYYSSFKCCSYCGIKWAEPNRDDWLNDGWRPDKEVLKNDLKIRLSIPICIRL